MGFDLQNFGVGLVTGWITAYGIYRFRRVIGTTVDATRNRATSAQSYATRSADGRYINDLIELCETTHLAGRFTKLSELVIEPRFLPAAALVAPVDADDIVHDVFHVVPQIPDHPYLHAIYNPETLSIDDLAGGSRMIALLGVPGSGRTTALFSIILRSLGRLRFEKMIDKIQQRLDAEEAALSEKERAARIKERNKIEELAREKLREQHDINFTVNLDAPQIASGSSFSQFMPVYVHLANIQLRSGEYGEQIDPAEPLVRAVQNQVGAVTAKSIPRNLYKRLTNGQVLLLVDGYDDLPEAERAEKLAWVRALTTEYEGNFVILAGPAQGYGALTQIGFTPLFLRPWNDDMQQRFVQHWTETWPQIGSKKRKAAPPPDDSLRERAQINNRALSPTDMTFKIWATYADDTEAAGTEGWLRAYVARYLPDDQAIGMVLPQMAQAAAVQLDNGFVTLARLEALARGASTVSDDDLLDALMESEPAKPAKSGKKSKEELEKERKIEEEASAHGKLISMLRNSGLIISYRGNRYQFRHPFVAAYLASLTLRDASPEALAAKALNPAWSQAIAYASLHTSVEPAVRARLSAPADVLNNHIFEVSRWLSYAGSNATWGGPLLKQLGNLLIAPNQYPLIRERAAAALIGTRDKNTLFVFRQAARNANADVRRLACLGMGAIGDPEAIKDLLPLLADKIVDVQLSAVMALGAIGTDTALEEMVLALTEGSEQIRQAVAESLAAIPDEGHPVLYDAIAHEEMMVRRAAAFGLRRVRTNWAVSALYRTFLEDDQWYVRSAAQQAFQDIQNEEHKGPQNYPAVDSITWLVNWAAAHGEGVPAGEGAIQVMMKALQEGEPELRALAARALGQLGEVSAARSLYAALRDRQDEVRAAAHRSLADFEAQLGQPLPAPV